MRNKRISAPDSTGEVLSARARERAGSDRGTRQLSGLRQDVTESSPGNQAVQHLLRHRKSEISGKAEPLHPSLRRSAESSLGVGLGDVRVFKGQEPDSVARAMGALAFTYGRDIFLSDRVPNTPNFVNAHEAVHAAQQKAAVSSTAREFSGSRSSKAQEGEADSGALAIMTGQSARATGATSQHIATFAPRSHREATVYGLAGSFSAAAIGEIYRSNWERDFSQGPPEVASVVAAWKAVLQSVESSGQPTPEAAGLFRDSVNTLVRTPLIKLLEESMSGYNPWEHLDRPDSDAVREAYDRWRQAGSTLSGHLEDGKAYIKDQMVDAVDAFRTRKQLNAIGNRFDNWQGVAKPKGYNRAGVRKAAVQGDSDSPSVSRDPVAKEAESAAKAIGVSDRRVDRETWRVVGHHLGRAMHATEDFFAHSNWLEMAQTFLMDKESDELFGPPPPEFQTEGGLLHTATFQTPDKIHALGHKLLALTGSLQSNFNVLLAAYGRDKASEKLNQGFLKPNSTDLDRGPLLRSKRQLAFGPLEADSSTIPGAGIDLLSLTTNMATLMNTGEVQIEDFLLNPQWLAALAHKAEELIEIGSQGTGHGGHGKLAKDQPEPGEEGAAFHQARDLATVANMLIFAPLRGVMETADAAAASAALTKQLAMVDRIIAPPSNSHPLIGAVSYPSLRKFLEGAQ